MSQAPSKPAAAKQPGAEASPRRRRTRRILRWLLVFLFVDVLAFVIIVFWGFGRVPNWYRPQHLSPEQVDRISDELAALNNQFSRDLFEDRLVRVELTQQQLSEWLLVSDYLRQWIPPELSDPVVVLRSDRVIIAALARHWGLDVVLGVSLRPVVDGERFRVEVVEVHMGGIGLGPRAMKWLFEERMRAAQPPERPGQTTISLLDLIDGESMPNRFRWPNGGREFRVDRVELEQGRVRLRIWPLYDD